MSALRYWECTGCYGTGKKISPFNTVYECEECDGTGNAMVNGPQHRHARRIREIEEAGAIKP